MIKGLFFDLDGTLFYTMEANIEAYRQAFNSLGIAFNVDTYKKNFGLRLGEMLKLQNLEVTEDVVNAIKNKKVNYYKDLFHLIKPNVFLLNFLKLHAESHITVVATTASRQNAIAILEHFGIRDHFNEIICGEDVRMSKPNPEIYELCLSRTGLKPYECLVFEDSSLGVKAAKSANLQVVRVPNNEK